MGADGGDYALLCTPCLVGTAAYLLGVRRSENQQNLDELQHQLEDMTAREA